MKKILLGLLVIGVAWVGLAIFKASTGTILGNTDLADTPMFSTTFSSTTINTTSTQIAASINQYLTITNPSSTSAWCKVDTTGTTAASSTVTSTIGYLIGAASTNYNSITFGDCWRGANRCVPIKGTVNCLGSAAAVYSLNSN